MRKLDLRSAELAELSAAVLDRGGCFRFQANGSSMLPFIEDGDVLTVRPTGAAALRTGDVALCRSVTGRLVVHRVVARRAAGKHAMLAIRGDVPGSAEEWVQTAQILGRVSSLERRGETIRLDGAIRQVAALLWVRLSSLAPVPSARAVRGMRAVSRVLRRLRQRLWTVGP